MYVGTCVDKLLWSRWGGWGGGGGGVMSYIILD